MSKSNFLESQSLDAAKKQEIENSSEKAFKQICYFHFLGIDDPDELIK
jgi:hypothetical protein